MKKIIIATILHLPFYMLSGQVLFDTVYVSDGKVTPLIFQDHIELVELGDTNYLKPVRDKANEEVLFLRPKGRLYIPSAPELGFSATNLLVKSERGEYYYFQVVLDPMAVKFKYFETINPPPPPPVENIISKRDTVLNKDTLLYSRIAQELLNSAPSIHNIGNSAKSMLLMCEDVKVLPQESLTALKFRLVNSSKRELDVSALQLALLDKQDILTSDEQQLYLSPLYAMKMPSKLAPKSQTSFVLVFTKISLPENRVVRVQLNESNSGAILSFYLEPGLFENQLVSK